jgi:hypothetical protein
MNLSSKPPLGKFKLNQIANMDQTPLPFCFMDGETYANTGDKTIIMGVRSIQPK